MNLYSNALGAPPLENPMLRVCYKLVVAKDCVQVSWSMFRTILGMGRDELVMCSTIPGHSA